MSDNLAVIVTKITLLFSNVHSPSTTCFRLQKSDEHSNQNSI